MHLSNNFKEEDRARIWIDHQYCADCKSNINCSIHHIDGRCSDSIYNSIVLCEICHSKADGKNTDGIKGEPLREKYTLYTILKIQNSDYINQQRDYIYLDYISHRLDNIKKAFIIN